MVALALWMAACAGPFLSSPDLVWQPYNQGLTAHTQVTALAFEPQHDGRVYAGTYGDTGLYLSEDRGLSWRRLTAATTERPVYVVSVPSSSPGLVLVGTGDGLLRSTDGGSTWSGVSMGVGEVSDRAPAVVYALARDRRDTLYLGGELPAVLRSADGGATWEPLAPLPVKAAVLALATTPDGDLLLAGTDGQGLWSSRDHGQSWRMAEGIGETFVAALEIVPWDSRAILARTRRGLFRSADGGQYWQQVASDVEGRIDAVTAVAAYGAIYLATNSGLVYRSRDHGLTWQRWGDGLGRRNTVFTLQADPSAPSTLYAGAYTGLYRSDDRGLTWRPVTDGPGQPSANALALAADGALYLGDVDGVQRLHQGDERWQPWRTGLSPDSVLALAVSPVDPKLLYAGTEGHGLYHSRDGGLTWEPGGWTRGSVPALALHPEDPDRLFMRVAYERVYASEDGGQSWTARWEGMDLQTEVISVVVNPHRPAAMYAGSTNAFFRSLDGGLTWQRTGPELAGQTVFAVAVDDREPERIYAMATRGAYRSDDDGQHWQPWGRGLEQITVTTVVQHPKRPQLVYVGTKYRGVYRSHNAGRTWRPAGQGLGDVSVNALVISVDGRWLWAATTRGVYRTPLR